MLTVESEIIPPIENWHICQHSCKKDGTILVHSVNNKTPLMESPEFNLCGGHYYIINLEFWGHGSCHTNFQLYDSRKCTIVKERHQVGPGKVISTISIYVKKDWTFKLIFQNYLAHGEKAEFNDFKVVLHSYDTLSVVESKVDTTLNKWSVTKKCIHRICKRSKHFNCLVAYVEMRLKREEVLSLPSFVAICPIGQCNANCNFCSVSGNREGITKKGMPIDSINKLIHQFGETVWMYGIEGNGEPLLYKHINKLIATILSKDSKVYLITNGSLLSQNLVYLLMSENVDAINFSLNAAKVETHKRIMGLQNFDEIKANIYNLSKLRGSSSTPFLSASLVVTRENVQEVIDFIALTNTLKIDRAYIRPLSELANVKGSVEDVREIVPYENDIHNLGEEIEDYIKDVNPSVEIVFEPTSFQAVQLNPLDGIIPVKGFDNKIIAPPRKYWRYDKTKVKPKWYLNTLNATWYMDDKSGMTCESIPVKQNVDLTFSCQLSVASGSAGIIIWGDEDRILATSQFDEQGFKETTQINIRLNTGESHSVRLSMNATAGTQATVEFEKLRVHPRKIDRKELLRNHQKWEVNEDCQLLDSANHHIRLRWEGSKYTYLLKSYAIPCYQNEDVALTADLNVIQGEVAIGVLNENAQHWISTFQYSTGIHDALIRFNSASNDKFQLVIYSNIDKPMEIEVYWQGFVEEDNQNNRQIGKVDSSGKQDGKKQITRLIGDNREDALPVKTATEGYNEDDATGPCRPLGKWQNRLKDFFRERKHVYCQKPWTDLSNFVVDGRMDVCCITTGESQKKYALGNLFEDDFQEIWNGSVMQRFRRTVNSEKHRLPPCSRCPMAYQKQGLFFSLGFTKEYVKDLMRSLLLNNSARIINLTLRIAKKLLRPILDHYR